MYWLISSPLLIWNYCIIHWLLSRYNYIYRLLIIPQNVNIVAEISVLIHTLSKHLNTKNMRITQNAIQVSMSTNHDTIINIIIVISTSSLSIRCVLETIQIKKWPSKNKLLSLSTPYFSICLLNIRHLLHQRLHKHNCHIWRRRHLACHRYLQIKTLYILSEMIITFFIWGH